MTEERGNFKQNKCRKKCKITIETPVAMDLSTDITRLFQVNAHKKKRISEYMCESIRKTKMITGGVNQLIQPLPSRPTTAKELLVFVDKSPSVGMPRLMEKRIRKMISVQSLELCHPQMLKEIIEEAKQEYTEILRCAGLNQKIKNCYPEVKYKIEPFKYLGRTDKYNKYKLTRNRIKSKWILHYPIIRNVLIECVAKIPYELCNLKFDEISQLDDIRYTLKDKAQTVSQFVYEFYVSIQSLVDKEYNKELDKKRKLFSLNYLPACTGILSVHISKAIARTVLHVVKFTNTNQPYISLNVTFDRGLILSPTAEEVIDTYHKFIDKILDSGRKMFVLQIKKIKGFENKYMPLCITEELISNCKQEVRENIEKLYEPITLYLKNMSLNLEQIYPDINSKDFIESISDITFESGCARIMYYKEYLNKVAFIPDHEFFQIGQMFLTTYRTNLHDGLKQNNDLIFEKLCAQHLWEVNDLCETFKMIHIRATQKPLTTEELIETGKYMNWIKNEHLAEITNRVEESLISLCQIIDLGFLTEEHMQLNAYVINWLDKISPVVEEHLVNFDQLKFDAEERLQKIVEDVNASIKAVYPLLVLLDDMDDISRVNSYLHNITLHMSKIKEIDEQISWINKEEICLSFPKSTYSEYDNLKDYVYPFYHLLKLCLDVQRNVSVWQDGPFENLNYESTQISIEAFYKELTDLYKDYRKKLRQAQDENLPIRFKGTIDDPDILNWPAPLKLCGKAMRLIDDFKPSVNITKIICNSSLRRRHWKAMSEIARTDITPNAGTTLKKMMTIDFYADLNEYEIISAGATKEKQLIDNLRALALIWEDIKFTVTKFKETNILTQLDEIEAVIDDHNIKILNMKSSVFVKPHEKEVTSFYGKILRISKTIDVWSRVQTQWVRLLPIFTTNHLSSVIPNEYKLFNKVMTIYDDYIKKIQEMEIVINIVETTDILNNICICLNEIEIIHKGVIAYLETIRQVFPRLYFVSEDELLSILTETEPYKSNTFFTKIFPGISQLTIEESKITGIESVFSEKVKFIDAIDPTQDNKLEKLCNNIEQQMITSLKNYAVKCYTVYKRNNIQQILSTFSQEIIRAVSQIFWTKQIKSGLGLSHNIKLRIYYQKLDITIKDKIRISNESDTTNLDRVKLKALIIDHLNLQYLLKKILGSGYSNENQFDWEAHTKYFLDDDIVIIQLMNTKTSYKYEYLGNLSLIILTPLTDRCYRTLINAQQFYFCGLLQGPGDTGKSETIKNFAGVFGTLLITFSCIQNLNTSTLVKFIKGSALCGSWLCLENLNSLKFDILSTFAQNVFAVLSALKSGLKRCFLENSSINIQSDWLITACVNTECLRREIPNNLRVLFRSVSLISPDVKLIIETMSYSLGFGNAKVLSSKIMCFFNTYQDIFVTQTHCFLGLSVLKKIFEQFENLRNVFPEEDEEIILFNAINAVLLPTIVDGDLKIFQNLLEDIFPHNYILSDRHLSLEPHIVEYLKQNNLQHSLQLTRKVTETYHYLNDTKGIILLGEEFTGKTTVLDVCEYLFSKTENVALMRNIVNPSSLHYDDLYGKYDSQSFQWTDGVMSKIIRNYSTTEDTSKKWLILDGNIDDTWTENIKDVLSDNSLFYLESGETISLRKTSVIFEVKNLDAASPSTISRCNLVYIPPTLVTWKDFGKSWINSCKSEWLEGYRDVTLDLLYWMVPPCLDFIESNCKQLCDLNNINLFKNVIYITQMTLDAAFISIARKEEDIKNLFSWIQATLISAGITGLGAVLDKVSMRKFDEFYRLLWKGLNKDNPYPNAFEKLDVIIPQEGLICDYQYLFKQRGVWKVYQDFLKNEKIVENPYMDNFLVPTADNLKFSSIFAMHIDYQYPLLVVGPPDTGKSLLIEHILINKINKEKYEISHINFNRYTESQLTQKYIISKLNKRKSGFYSPPTNKSFLLFIDNLNLLTIDKHNSSHTMELLRQQFDSGVWYDLKNYNPIYVQNINVISAINPTEIKQKKLCKRFLRHFSVFCLDAFSDDSTSRIYSNILQNIWKKSGFPSDINTIISQIISATIKIYHSLVKRCKPTLNTCYYTFSLLDVTKVIKSCGNLKKETYDNNKKIYINLWSHEIQRVFGDRLKSTEYNCLLDDITNVIKEEFNNENNETENESTNRKIFFGSFNDKNLPVSERRYEEIDIQNLQNSINEELIVYNNSHAVPLSVIFFNYALERLIKICRILSISPGNAMLLGPTSTGRETLTKLAGHIYKQQLFQPTITANYTITEWNKDVKSVLKETGGLEKQCVFLVTEEQLIDETFLLNIDILLRDGEIPNIYDTEEKQEILELARLSAQGGNRNLDISSADVFLYFNKKCKENLHIIICHSISTALRNRIRNHSSLMNCYVICFEDWPDEGLECVSQTWVKDLNLTEDIKQKITESSIYFYRTAQTYAQKIIRTGKMFMCISSKSFIHNLKLFATLINVKQKEIESTKKRYEQALGKLSYAANQILKMQKALAEYQPQLEEMTQKAIEMTEQIALETIQVEKASALVRNDEKIAGDQAIVAQILKSECEAELAQAIPILEDAISALNTLKPSDITLVKSMKNPPDAIKLVMAAVCVIKDVKPEKIPDPSTGRKTLDYWGPSKRILGDMNFLQTLKDFDKDNIKSEIMVKIRKEYLPHKDFKPHVVAKASSAAEGLCKWIIAMDMYDKVAKEVAPKKEKLEKAEKEYAGTMAVLNEKKEELNRLEKKLAELNDLLAEAIQKQVKLQQEVDYCKKKLSSAQQLIGSLSQERSKWTESVKNLETQYLLLPGNILLFSGIVAYLAPLNQENRECVVNIWQDHIKEKLLPGGKYDEILNLLSTDKEIQFWLRNEIPSDQFFLVNATIKKHSQYYSIFIDPHYQAFNWIQKIERKNKISLLKFTDSDYLSKLKDVITQGKPILIHRIKNVIPPCVVQLLEKQMFYENDEVFVKLNDDMVRVDKNFRLYMVCNMSAPNFSPDMYNRVTLINFEITEKALSESLLKVVTEIEKPELKRLTKEVNLRDKNDREAIYALEEKILNTLCESEIDILEDEASIQVLGISKDSVKDVYEKQKQTITLQTAISDFKNDYVDVSKFSANLFYCVNQLKRINYVYEFSLNWYIDQFFRSVLNAKLSKNTIQRCTNIKDSFTYKLFLCLKNSLLEEDKLIFLFLLCTQILIFDKKIVKEDVGLFLTKNLTTVWTSESILQIEKLHNFNGFLTDVSNNVSFWQQFFEKPCLDLEDFPPPWNIKLNNFQKLTLIKFLRKDMVLRNFKKLVVLELGANFVSDYYFNLDEVYNDSYSLSPTIIFQSPEINVTQRVILVARRKQMASRLKILSLSSDQNEIIDHFIERAQNQGSWVLVENCHLNPQWLQRIEQSVIEMDVENTHEHFRLWLTSNPSRDIPIELLQNSTKVVAGNTEVLKEKLMQIYKTEPVAIDDFYNGCPKKFKYFTRSLYALSFYHCILQKKAEFGTIFSAVPYIFSEDDLNVSMQQLQLAINKDRFHCEYLEKLIYLIGNCNYSGYLNSEWDIRIVVTLARDYIRNVARNGAKSLFNSVESYGLPKKNDYKDYMLHISKLPNQDDPRLFNLNDVTFNSIFLKQSNNFIKSLRGTIEYQQQADLSQLEFEILISIDTVIKKLPSVSDLVFKSVKSAAIEREIKQYQILLSVVSNSLFNLKRAFSGEIRISLDDEETARSILSNEVPRGWFKFSYPHNMNLANYIQNLCQRINFFQGLCNDADKHMYWLEAFFFPKAFLCEIKSEYCRKTTTSLENIVFEYKVLKVDESVENGTAFNGLYIKGARWDEENHQLSQLKKLCNSFPPILFKPVNVTEYSEDCRYTCPIYQTDNVTDEKIFLNGSKNFICSTLLPTDRDLDYWVKCGVKIICQAPTDKFT